MKRKYYTHRGSFLDGYIRNFPSGEFTMCDNQERFQRNLKEMPDDWHYRHKKIYYQNNKQGYRAPEFDTVDWQNSIVVFGCSHVYGVGLADDETLCYHLEQITGKPVINMGIPAVGVEFCYCNQLALHEQCKKPCAIVNLWPAAERMLHFEPHTPVSVGPWVDLIEPKYRQMYLAWIQNSANPAGHAWVFKRSADILWQDLNHYYECTFSPEHQLDVDQIKGLDFARDLVHFGTKTMKHAAIKIAEGLNV